MAAIMMEIHEGADTEQKMAKCITSRQKLIQKVKVNDVTRHTDNTVATRKTVLFIFTCLIAPKKNQTQIEVTPPETQGVGLLTGELPNRASQNIKAFLLLGICKFCVNSCKQNNEVIYKWNHEN